VSPLEVLHADNHLLVVHKPACVPMVPDESGDASLLELAKAWIKREANKPGEVFLGVVHRLDRPVSGVVALARTSKAASRLSEQFRAGRARKLYVALGEGSVRGSDGVLEQWLLKDEARNLVRAVAPSTQGAKLARTVWRAVPTADSRTRFEFEPATGRAHQLRVAAATLGAPLLGDLKYGAREPLPDKSVALHALALEFEHPTLRKPMRFESPPELRPRWLG
jgi:23S rRNA pseudouridine1911/1915/1917 synthase